MLGLANSTKVLGDVIYGLECRAISHKLLERETPPSDCEQCGHEARGSHLDHFNGGLTGIAIVTC